MYTDLYNNLMVNRKLIRTVGLAPAVYLSEILNFMPQVIKKHTFNSDTGLFTIKRDYITEQLAFTEEEQHTCDEALLKAGLLIQSPDNKDEISLRLDALTAMITSEDTKLLKSISKATKVSVAEKRKAKKEGTIVTMQKLAADEDPELNTLYADWVTSVYENKRFLTKAAIEIFRTGIKKAAGQSKSVEIELLKSAISTGYSNPEWVIGQHTRSAGAKTTMQTSQKISTGVSETEAF